jgi:hypothetical protein
MNSVSAGLAVIFLLGRAERFWRMTGRRAPDEDGTKPALTRIAGEGNDDSHAFQYLTELSDDIGSRVTDHRGAQAEEWGAAKMKAIGLENVHSGKVHDLEGLDARGTAEAQLRSADATQTSCGFDGL